MPRSLIHPFSSLVACAVLLSAGLSAQSGSYTSYGAPSGSPTFGHHIAISGTPRIGSSLTVTLGFPPDCGSSAGSPVHWDVFLVTGVSRSAWGGVPLPARTPLGFTLLVAPDWGLHSRALAPMGGPPCPTWGLPGVRHTFSIPSDVRLLGVEFFQQYVFTEGYAWWATEGGHGVIGA